MSYSVFISSTKNDIELARDVARRLEAAGISVFPVDKTAVPEDKIVTNPNQALPKADEVLIILTKDSGDSPGLLSEMGMAFALKKKITPVLVNLDEDKMPPMLKQIHPVKYAELQDYISKLAGRISLPKARGRRDQPAW